MTPFGDRLKKHIDDADRERNSTKKNILLEIQKHYLASGSFRGIEEYVEKKNAFESFLDNKKDDLKVALKERQRTDFIGCKLEEIIGDIITPLANKHSLEVFKGAVVNWVGFAPTGVKRNDISMDYNTMNPDAAIVQTINLITSSGRTELKFPFVYIQSKEYIYTYMVKVVSKEAESAKFSNPNLLFLVVAGEESIAENKKHLLNLWMKEVDGLYIFRDCKRYERQPYKVDIIKQFQKQVSDHLERLSSGPHYASVVNPNITDSNF